jgi:hypothetical protein
MGNEYYDTAQICLNGHTTNYCSRTDPIHDQRFCVECGAETIRICPECKSPIRGYFHSEWGGHDYKLPFFCYSCGAQYPWTKSRLQAAQDLISEMENIDDIEKAQLMVSVQEMTRDTPQSQVASVRYRKIISKVGKEAGLALRDIIINIVSETVRRSLFGP